MIEDIKNKKEYIEGLKELERIKKAIKDKKILAIIEPDFSLSVESLPTVMLTYYVYPDFVNVPGKDLHKLEKIFREIKYRLSYISQINGKIVFVFTKTYDTF